MNMKPKHLIRQLFLSSIMMVAGITSAFAGWGYEKIDGGEGGGGTYTFRNENRYFSYGGDNYDSNHLDWFWTQKRFDGDNDLFYFEFEMRVCCDMIIDFDKSDWNMLWHDSEVKQTFIEGDVFVVSDDDVMHKIGHWQKAKTDKSYITYSSEDNQEYGGIRTYNMDADNGHVKIRFLPRRRSFLDGVKRIIFKNRLVFKDTRQWGWFQYEKDIDLNYFDENKPMHKLSVEWNDEGSLSFKASDMLDISKSSRYIKQYYEVYQYLYPGYKFSRSNKFYLDTNDVNTTSSSNNKVDVTFSKWYADGGVYTIPVCYKYQGVSNLNVKDAETTFSDVWYFQPYITDMVLPYTRPENLKVEFDKWNKTNTITWTKRENTTYYDGSKTGTVECKTDGKWYIIRYDNGKNAKNDGYKLLGSVNGTSSNLKYTDKNIDYDCEYVYRVIFLPTILENKYKENLADLPGQSSSHSSNDLWEEKTVSTLMEVPIKLSQDRTYEKAVRLVWEYNVQLKGLDWRINWRPQGTTTWKAIGETLPIDTKQSIVHYDAEGTVCDLIEYQVMTTINGKELASNILVGNLPAGSYISEVTASTGTEEGNVIVKWKVARADKTNESYYRVLRRPIGTEEWTLLTDEIHGTASEYQYTDYRVSAGSYYEYTVEAFNAVCDEQFVQTDAQIAPGFSQARGTITGHIAFGSGTAVRDVRVNLVKSSADEVSDSPQYLSRYIDGEGKGLTWIADSAKYASNLNGKKDLTLQLWVKPMIEGGESKQAFLNLNNALELGVKRISDNSTFDIAAEISNGYDAEGRYIIATAADWEEFAQMVNSGSTTLDAVMTADIDLEESQTMIGDTEANCYRGHFEGNGHTLKVNYYVHSSTNRDGGYRTAPFSYVGDGFAVQNLHVMGKISTNAKFAGGIVGGIVSGTVTLTRCWSSVTIEGRAAGDGTHGGILSMTNASSLNINSCLFDGVIKGDGLTNCAGMIGWIHDNRTAQLTNCLVNPESVPVSEGFYTYARSRSGNAHELTNCYYTQKMGKEQGQPIAVADLTPSTLGDGWTSNELSQVVPQLIEGDVNNIVNYSVDATVHQPKTSNNNDNIYCLYAVDLTHPDSREYKVTEFQNLTLDNFDFTHVTARYKDSSWIFSVGKDTLLCDTLIVADATWQACRKPGSATFSLGGSKHVSGNAFKGNVDDVRLWNRALSTKEIDNNYNRILGGIEDGLMLYWPLDEGINIRDYVFDVTQQDGIYLQNHPIVGANAVPSAIVPQHLKLYGMTDAEGDYIIRGIPFQQGGTNYKVMPELGVHEFSPNSSSMFISPTSLTANNVNFEDVSSFPMEGYIYYAGTNIPAEGIMFYVDGELLSEDGKAEQTDADGFYSISVPIGKHYVTAKLDGHTMANGGRFPLEGTFNFDRAMTCDFADSTLVNFVGRVGGGERNDTLAVGFGESKNNIGIATITLKLNNESFSFNCQDDRTPSTSKIRSFESDTTSIRSNSWAGIDEKSRFIFIRTDSLTGEFSAKLPPLKYITKSVKIDRNPDIEFTSLPEIDLTNLQKQMKDSLLVEDGNGETKCIYYNYNTKKVFAYYATPTLNIWQKDNGVGAFGVKSLDYVNAPGDTLKIKNIWTKDNEGIHYAYNYPIFEQDESYTFGIKGFEAYVNKDGKSIVNDTILLNDLIVSVANEMSDEQTVVGQIYNSDSVGNLKVGQVVDLKKNELKLSKDGVEYWTWKAGAPNIISPYTRNFSASFERNGRTYVWNNLNAIVLGELSQGNNFVTEGPDKPLMVLRDPPGAKSKTTWKSGTTTAKVKTRVIGWTTSDAVVMNNGWGVEFTTASGSPILMLVSKYKTKATLDVKIQHKGELTRKHEEVWSTTVTDAISTSTDQYHVGSMGDVFIGISNNILVGDCNRLGFYTNLDGTIVLDCRKASMLSLEERTSFFYSAYEIEKVMIPKWKALRNELLHYMPEEQCKSYTNNTKDPVYLTWLNEDDPLYGDTLYVCVPPVGQNCSDKVDYYNQQVKNWEGILRQNERDKWTALSDEGNRYHIDNISFDGGTSYSTSERKDTTDVTTHIKNGNETFSTVFRCHFYTTAGGHWTSDLGLDIENGVKWEHVDSDPDENTKTFAEFDYDFNDGNRGTDFSVDIYKSPQGWSNFFSILGGQSYNPYEGPEYARYYQPEEKHILSNGTQQMEQPDIRISIDGQNSAKTLTVTDIPSGQKQNLTLHLTNNNMTQQPFDMTYNLIVAETTNNNGLQVYMDGVPMNGRSVLIPKNETVLKTITISQTDQSKLDHKGVKIRFASPYQPLLIYDEVTLNATFVPSSSPVDLIINEPLINTISEDSLEMKIANFDRNFTNLKYVGVQYKFEGSTSWSEFCRFDSAYIANNIVPDRGYLRKWIDMRSDVSYPQGKYTFRAFTMTKYGTDDVYAYSDDVTVIKDNISPRPLTTPTPANGILGYGEDMSIEFNEDIVPGYVGDKNVIITARLNDKPINHEVAYLFTPHTSANRTRNPIFLNGDFSCDFWLKWNQPGTILQHGKGQNMFAVSIDNDGHVHSSIAGTDYVSLKSVPTDEWLYLVISYKSSDMTFSMLAQYDNVTIELFDNEKVNPISTQVVHYADDNYLYINCDLMSGAMHDLSLFNIYRDVHEAANSKYQAKNVYTYGLTNYWPMNEGHGYVIADARHTHDFDVINTWLIDNKNYSANLTSPEGLTANIATLNTTIGDSYAIEMWIYPNNVSSEGATLFETGTVASNKLRLHFDADRNLWLDYGEKSQMVVDYNELVSFDFGSWSHVALNVLRGQAASFYFNGQRTAVIAETELPRVEGAVMKIGEGYIGYLDEIRYWRASLSEKRLLSNMFNCIDTTSIYSRGLAVYLPFEKESKASGYLTKNFTFENMAPGSNERLGGDAQFGASTNTPPIKSAPEESTLLATPVASERKVVINLKGSTVTPRDIEGTTLNITLADVHDLHGNTSQPIRWSAYVQQNNLKWEKDSVRLVKQYGDDLTFDVNIVNKSGNIEYYSVENLPQWLTLVESEINDNVAPLSTKTLRFRVDPLVRVGKYDLTIGLQGNLQILEPLRITMKVSGEKPNWSFDPLAFEHQMTIIGQVRIDGILMENNESIVAAFIDGECRGLASPEPVRGAAYVTLGIYGNDYKVLDQDKPVTFAIYDATTGMTYIDANLTLADGTQTNILFSHDELIGNFDEPAIWSKSGKVEQQVPMHQNWNWIALGVEPEDSNPDQVFSAFKYWALTVKDQGSTFASSNGVQWDGPLTMQANTMYKVKITPTPKSETLPSQLTVQGRQVNLADAPVTIYENWTWIAYTPLYTMSVDEALAGVNPERGDRIKSQTGIAIYGNTGWEGNLKSLESGHGYMYFSTVKETKSFVYPTYKLSNPMMNAPRMMSSSRVNDDPTIFTPVDKHLYPDNMTMVIQLLDGSAVVDTAEVAAFIDGECRGATRAYNGLYYLIITGEGSNKPMQIYSCIDGRIVLIDDSQFFVSDDNIGDPWAPYVIDLQHLPEAIDGVYADDDADDDAWYTLQGFRLIGYPESPGIYIHNGEKVAIGKKAVENR